MESILYQKQYSLAEVQDIAQYLATILRTVSYMTFEGSLGAGKTTLIREMLREYGVSDLVTSPTYTYLNIYHDTDGMPIYHFDLYRLKNRADFLSAGFDEYLHEPHAKVLLEWPEYMLSLLPPQKTAQVSIDYGDQSELRTITVTHYR